jgi:hypothetical protein
MTEEDNIAWLGLNGETRNLIWEDAKLIDAGLRHKLRSSFGNVAMKRPQGFMQGAAM